MKCRAVKRRLHLLYYKELGERETTLLRKHLDHCSQCRDEYNETIALLDAMPHSLPHPSPREIESDWAGILSAISHSAPEIRHFPRIPARIAAAILLFALGLGTGLWLERNPAPGNTQEKASEFALSRLELNGFLEDVEMLLLDTSHNPRAVQTASMDSERKFVIDRLMFQNRQLSRNHASPRHIHELLEETALLLREIRNHPDLETGDPDWLPRIIEQRRLRERIRALLIKNREVISMEGQRAPII